MIESSWAAITTSSLAITIAIASSWAAITASSLAIAIVSSQAATTASSRAATIASSWVVVTVPALGILEPYRQFVAVTSHIVIVFDCLAAELLILLYDFQEEPQ